MKTVEGYCEGDTCNRGGCKGVIEVHPVENCSCHICPPCGACTSPRNFCPVCGWEEADEPQPQLPPAPKREGLVPWPLSEKRALDPTKIDYHSLGHTNFTMIQRGVYPEGTTMEQVRAAVKGTFGGRFNYFGNGKFEYVAYTD